MLCPNDFIASDGYPKVFIDDSEQMMDGTPQLIDTQFFIRTLSTKQVYYETLLELRNHGKYQFTSIKDPYVKTEIQMNNQDNREEIRKPRSSKVKILNVNLPNDLSSNAAEDLTELISRLYNY